MVKGDRVCPIFLASNTHCYGIPQIINFLGKIESRSADTNAFGTPAQPVEYDIHETFMVHGTGFVVSGMVKAGTIKTGQTLILGPDEFNSTKQVVVKSVYFNRMSVAEGRPGQFCTLALKALKKKDELTRKDFRKGAVLLDSHSPPKFSIGFEASVSVLHHATTIKSGYECMFHSGVVRQAIKIVSMDRELLRTGEAAQIKFQFLYRPEFIKQDAPFLMREGRTKILGVITKLIYSKEDLHTPGSSKTFD
jgi:GTPase